MKKKMIAMLLAALGLAVGCNTQPRPGIEAGNPNVSVKSVRVLPKDGSEIYEVTLLDDTTANVSQVQDGDELSLLDEVIVPYRLEKNVLILEALFANERAINVTAAFSPTGDAVSGVLKVDGGFAEACFEVPGQTPSCDASSGSPSEDTTQEVRSTTETPPVFTTETDPITRGPGKPILGGGSLTSPSPPADDASTRTQASDPYGAYCTTIDGRPACKIPLNIGDVVAVPAEKPAVSEIGRQITLTRDTLRVLDDAP